MIQEAKKEFIPHPQSLTFKKLGFNEECMSVYSEEGELSPLVNMPVRNSNVPSYCTAPTYRQAFKWFRDTHKLLGYVLGCTGGTYGPSIYKMASDYNREIHADYGTYKTYEEAELGCLKKLIEIVENSGNHVGYLTCSKCKRRTYSEAKNTICNMPQPSGKNCDGVFE